MGKLGHSFSCGTRHGEVRPPKYPSYGGKPLLLHALGTAQQLKPSRIAVIIGHGADRVRQVYSGGDVSWAIQEQQLGTGHAVLCAREAFADFAGDIVILSGDVPLIRETTLRAMVELIGATSGGDAAHACLAQRLATDGFCARSRRASPA